MNTEKPIKSIVLRVLFIIAIVVVILILAFAIIRIIPIAFSSFASVGNLITSPFRSNTVEVSSNDSSLLDGDRFVLNWNYSSKINGEYKLTYKCIDGVKLNVFENNSYKSVLCNTKYPLSSENRTIELQAQYSVEDSFIDLPIEVLYIDSSNQNVEAKGEIFVTIQNSDNPTPVGDNAGATITTEPVSDNDDAPRTTPVIRNIPADLAITDTAVLNNQTFQFSISNIGGANTGNWFFNYTIPGEGIETSPLQPNLAPGQGIRYTLTFDNSVRGISVISIDPNNSVFENSEFNNTVSISINGGTSSNNNSSNNNSSNNSGSDDADLEISDLMVGRMSGSRFIEDNSIDDSDDAGVQFTVKNIGDKSSGTWRFEITGAPYDDEDDSDYRSSNRASLNPGESVTITVDFDDPDAGRYEVEVEIDSDDDVDEIRESNNDDSITLRVIED